MQRKGDTRDGKHRVAGSDGRYGRPKRGVIPKRLKPEPEQKQASASEPPPDPPDRPHRRDFEPLVEGPEDGNSFVDAIVNELRSFSVVCSNIENFRYPDFVEDIKGLELIQTEGSTIMALGTSSDLFALSDRDIEKLFGLPAGPKLSVFAENCIISDLDGYLMCLTKITPETLELINQAAEEQIKQGLSGLDLP
jgi:hypothetical protein